MLKYTIPTLFIVAMAYSPVMAAQGSSLNRSILEISPAVVQVQDRHQGSSNEGRRSQGQSQKKSGHQNSQNNRSRHNSQNNHGHQNSQNNRRHQRYVAGRHYGSAPRGWRNYSYRPDNWQTQGCIVVGPVWYCP